MPLFFEWQTFFKSAFFVRLFGLGPPLGGTPPSPLRAHLLESVSRYEKNNTSYKKHAVVATLLVFLRLGSNLAPLGRLLGGTCLTQGSSWLVLARIAFS